MRRHIVVLLLTASAVIGAGPTHPDLALAEQAYQIESGAGAKQANEYTIDASSGETWTAEEFRIESLKVPSADKGSASLVVYYMGDSRFILFFQETVRVKQAMAGYDKVVLLKFDKELEIAPWLDLDLSPAEEKIATIIDTPVRCNVEKYLKQLADEGYYIDVWIWGHGHESKGWKLSDGTYGTSEYCGAEDIEKFASNAGYLALPIRMVWSTLCYGNKLNSAWRQAGAKVVSGARFIEFYPTNFNAFVDNWNGGMNYVDALGESETHHGGVNTFICNLCAPSDRYDFVADGYDAWVEWLNSISGYEPPEWIGDVIRFLPDWWEENCSADWGPKCPLFKTVCSDNECAKAYFVGVDWLSESEWQDGMSGEENMNYSGQNLIQGDGKITKSTKPSWN